MAKQAQEKKAQEMANEEGQMKGTARRVGAMFVALGVLVGAAGLLAGPAAAQTTSGGATADEGSVASGTGDATNGSTASGGATADNGSTASGDAVATDGSVASGCSTAADGSTASGAPCPSTTVTTTGGSTTTKPGDGKTNTTRRGALARTGSDASGLVTTATAALFTGLLLLALGVPARDRRVQDAQDAQDHSSATGA